MEFRIQKSGKSVRGAVVDVSSKDAAPAQDVGIFANASSERDEPCRVEFQYLKMGMPGQGEPAKGGG